MPPIFQWIYSLRYTYECFAPTLILRQDIKSITGRNDKLCLCLSFQGIMGAASPMGSLDRVKSLLEDGQHSPFLGNICQDELQMAQALNAMPTYTYKEISQATNGFPVQNKLGQGKFGTVYFGILKNTKCAIKKLVSISSGYNTIF